MIRITIELWPFGQEDRKTTLASADIWNDGTGTHFLGSYGFRLFGKGGRLMREGALGEFRRSAFHVWWLVAACMKVAFAEVEMTFRDKLIVGRLK